MVRERRQSDRRRLAGLQKPNLVLIKGCPYPQMRQVEQRHELISRLNASADLHWSLAYDPVARRPEQKPVGRLLRPLKFRNLNWTDIQVLQATSGGIE